MLTLEPYDLKVEDAPDIVRQMIECSAVFGIGPMSAVAGVIAKFAVKAMIEAGAVYAIVDNGGDISVLNDRPFSLESMQEIRQSRIWPWRFRLELSRWASAPARALSGRR